MKGVKKAKPAGKNLRYLQTPIQLVKEMGKVLPEFNYIFCLKSCSLTRACFLSFFIAAYVSLANEISHLLKFA